MKSFQAQAAPRLKPTPGRETPLEALDDLLLWMDEDLLALNKPAGLLTIPDGYDPSLPNLAAMLKEHYGPTWVIHRLDKDTSGVILFARNAEAHRQLNAQFAHRETQKEYHCLFAGQPEWTETQIDLPLRVNGDRRHRTVVDHSAGKAAQTTIRVLQRLGLFTFAAAIPHTGYTHQIRSHLAAIGFPILADALYLSRRPDRPEQIAARDVIPTLPIQRVALHAFQLTFTHPVTGERRVVQAPYPTDFRETLAQLQQFNEPD